MTPKDTRHYKFLRRAIELKYRFPDQSAFETFSYDPYIFRWASNTFYELKLFDYLDIKERAVLVRIYKNLKKDPRLKFLDDPDSLKDQDQFRLPESFHAKIASEQAKLSSQTPQTAPLGGAPPRVSFGAGNTLKNLSSQSSIFLKKNVFGKILTPTRLVTGFTTILGGIAGSVLGPVGSLAGAGAGFLAPSYIKTFGARHLGGLANWGADSMVRLSNQTSRFSVGGFGGRSVTGKRFTIAAILLFFGVGALAAFAPLPSQETSPAAAVPLTPGFINTLAPPPSPEYQKLHDDILKQFGVDFDQQNTFSYDYLKWAWGKLWNISNTNFLKLTRGPNNNIITIKRLDRGFNEQITCSSILMSGTSSATGQPYPESLFKIVFIHELSHIIENCYRNTSNIGELANIRTQEGGITSFSQNTASCISGVSPLNEDFAETITYYLNPEFGEQRYFNDPKCPAPADNLNPFARGDKPLHQQFAAKLLGVASLTPQTTPTSLPKFSCPVIGGGVNRLPSFQADPVNGHCGSAYNAKLRNPADACSGNTRRGKSIDIETGGLDGKLVTLPTIDGQTVGWEYVQQINLTSGDCFEEEIIDPSGAGGGCGVGYVFRADLGEGKNWVIHLLHMQPVSLTPGLRYQSGPVTAIGNSQAIHVHISMGQDIKDVLSQDEAGWKSVDTELNLCK